MFRDKTNFKQAPLGKSLLFWFRRKDACKLHYGFRKATGEAVPIMRTALPLCASCPKSFLLRLRISNNWKRVWSRKGDVFLLFSASSIHVSNRWMATHKRRRAPSSGFTHRILKPMSMAVSQDNVSKTSLFLETQCYKIGAFTFVISKGSNGFWRIYQSRHFSAQCKNMKCRLEGQEGPGPLFGLEQIVGFAQSLWEFFFGCRRDCRWNL